MSDEGGDDRYPLLPSNAAPEIRTMYALLLGLRDHLRLQDRIHERDKQQAIDARTAREARDDDKHALIQKELRETRETATNTGGRVALLERTMDEEVQPVVEWWRDEGSKLGGRVSTLEQFEVARSNAKAQAAIVIASTEGEKRGRTWAITKIIALIAAICGVLGWLGADRLSAFLFSISVKLGHG